MVDGGIIEQRSAAGAAETLHYPDSDGHFLPDNPLQARAVISLRNDLEQHFEGVPNVVLEGDMFLYYRRGDLSASVAPDVFVVLDHDLGRRPTYQLWVEGKPPDFALEVISPSSAIRNQESKKQLYASLGIREYFLFQPDVKRPGPRLAGYRLWGKDYVEVQAEGGDGGELRAETLGVSLRPEGPLLRVRNLETRQDYAWLKELRTELRAAEARIAQLESMLARTKGQTA